MADHLRDQILAGIEAQLQGLTTTGARVFLDEDNPLEDGQLPGITITQGDESTEADELGRPRLMQAFLDVDVRAYIKRTASQADVRTKINTICKEVQAKLASPGAWAVLPIKKITLVQTSFELNGDAEQPVAMAQMRWQVFYCFYEDAPDVAA